MPPDLTCYILIIEIHMLQTIRSIAQSDPDILQQRDHRRRVRRVHSGPEGIQAYCAVNSSRIYIQITHLFCQALGQGGFSRPGRPVDGNAPMLLAHSSIPP